METGSPVHVCIIPRCIGDFQTAAQIIRPSTGEPSAAASGTALALPRRTSHFPERRPVISCRVMGLSSVRHDGPVAAAENEAAGRPDGGNHQKSPAWFTLLRAPVCGIIWAVGLTGRGNAGVVGTARAKRTAPDSWFRDALGCGADLPLMGAHVGGPGLWASLTGESLDKAGPFHAMKGMCGYAGDKVSELREGVPGGRHRLCADIASGAR